MAGNLVLTTPKVAMHALAFKGIMAYACFPQIRDMLMRRFGEEYVLLFSRPEEDRASGNLDWYTPVQGAAKPLSSLQPEKAQRIRSRIGEIASDINAYADELIAGGDPLRVTRGHILKLALHYPDESTIFVVGEHPVITCWGFGSGSPGVQPYNLARMAQIVQTPPVRRAEQEARPCARVQQPYETPPQPVRRSAFPFFLFWWLLPLLAAILLLLLLFASIGNLPALSGREYLHLPAPFSFPEDYTESIVAVENEIKDLQTSLADHIAQCTSSTKQGTQKNTISIQQDAQQDVLAFQQDTRNMLQIPKQARDVSFMEGTWLCMTGLAKMSTGEPVKVIFNFNRNGEGTGTVIEKNDRCSGNVRARLQDDVLHMDLDRLQCVNDPYGYWVTDIECRNTKYGKAACRGTNSDGSTWDAIFLRQ